MKYTAHFTKTPQREPIPLKDMVQNAAGGYVFKVDDFTRLRRFLILGCEGGSYYEGERQLTLENAQIVKECALTDAAKTVQAIVEVSTQNLAPKNDAAIFALAIVTKYGNTNGRHAAFAALKQVCRTGYHLFQFVKAREAIGGGWGRGMREAVSAWYDRDDIARQVLKYRNREGWSHKDVLRLAHTKLPHRAHIIDAIYKPEKWEGVQDRVVEGYLKAKGATSGKEVARLVTEYGLDWEMIPNEFLTDAQVWAALLPHMGLMAMVRNLSTMSALNLLTPLSSSVSMVVNKLSDSENIKRSRLHPFWIAVNARNYALGRSAKTGKTWNVSQPVVDAMNDAYPKAFTNVTPTGKRYLLSIDVSGSMTWSISACPTMTSAEAAAIMAVATARSETNYHIMGFATQYVDLGITAKTNVVDVMRKTRDLTMGGTDATVAMRWAMKNKVPVDVFATYTDNETWAGKGHTCQVLEEYRQQMGINAKHAVVAFTATNRSLADPGDLNSMDFVGLDASLPQLINAFVSC